MKTSNRDRQRKWRQKQASNGKQPLTVMISAEIKDLIDRKRKQTGSTIAHIIETAVANQLVTPTAPSQNYIKEESNQGVKDLSAKTMQQISADLKAIVHRFEKMAGLSSGVTCNEKSVTNDVSPQPEPEAPLTTEIYRLVRLLNNMEVGPDEIALTLNKRKFSTLSGSQEWKVGDVNEVLEIVQQKYGHINPLFSISGNP